MNNAKVAIQNSTENRKINKKQHQNTKYMYLQYTIRKSMLYKKT